MPGYEKVTDISQLTSGTKYLITAKADDGTYYAVNPSAASSNFNHVAKVVEENIPIKEEASVALGTNAQFDNGGEKKISKCLFTFDKQEGTENQYKITAVTEDGKRFISDQNHHQELTDHLSRQRRLLRLLKMEKHLRYSRQKTLQTANICIFGKMMQVNSISIEMVL